MAISTSYTFAPTADAILRQAFFRCGLLPFGRPLPAGWLSDGLDMMNTVLKSSQARASRLNQEEASSQVLTSGTSSYVLAADTLDIIEPVMLELIDGETEQELRVSPWSEYGRIVDKQAQGLPLQVFFDLTSSFTMVLYPVPDAAYTVNFRRVRFIRNMESGAELDLHQRWVEWLTVATAAAIGPVFNLPEQRILRLNAQAEIAYKNTKMGESDVGDVMFMLGDF